jgi:Leucine-rich repeat (LRR) protein
MKKTTRILWRDLICFSVLVVPLLYLTIPSFLRVQNLNKEAYFPDPQFRSFVESLVGVDHGGYFTKEDTLQLKGIVICNYRDIQSLKGIEHFTHIEGLQCTGNRLTELDLSTNVRIRYLDCSNNRLTRLNVSNCSELRHLDCSDNALTILDLSPNINLIRLDISFNRFDQVPVNVNAIVMEALDVRNNPLNDESKQSIQNFSQRFGEPHFLTASDPMIYSDNNNIQQFHSEDFISSGFAHSFLK